MESEGEQIAPIICAVVPRHTTPTSCMLLRTNAGVPRLFDATSCGWQHWRTQRQDTRAVQAWLG